MLFIFSFSPTPYAEAQTDSLIKKNIPQTPRDISARISQYENTRSASFSGFSADGSGIYILTRFCEVQQVHYVATPEGVRRQLTFFNEPVASAIPSPVDPDVFVFTSDTGGAEDFQVYTFNRRTGKSALISDGLGRKAWPTWSNDGKRLAWSTTLEATELGIVVADPNQPESRQLLFRGEGSWFPLAWSPDDQWIALYRFMSLGNSEIHLLNAETGQLREINPAVEPVGYGRFSFSADGQHVYLALDQGSDNLALYQINIETGNKTLLSDGGGYDVEFVTAAADGKTFAYSVNEEGRSVVTVVSTASGAPVPLPALPIGVVTSLDYSPDSSSIAVTLESSRSPGDVWMIHLSDESPQWIAWTTGETGGLPSDLFVSPETIRYPTFDEVSGKPRTIPAFVYRPRTTGPHPVIISIHGGPSFQTRAGFSARFQHWVNELGVVVIAPNVRGSTGYSKAFQLLDDQMKREDSVKDIGALLDWIALQPDLDAQRVLVHGSSYGGYMVLASLVRYSDRLAGGIDIVGISNFVTFLESTAEYRRPLRRPEYGDERDPEMRAYLNEISPLTHANKIHSPLFIIQGLNDPRVPASEAEQILTAVEANGIEAWYLAARDEGHGFQKKSNINAMNEAITMFILETITAK